MALTLKPVNDWLVIAGATLYTCPVGKQAWVKSIVLVNTDSVARTINLKLDNAVEATMISEVDQSLDTKKRTAFTEGYPMTAGQTLYGAASADNVVSVILGIIEQPV